MIDERAWSHGEHYSPFFHERDVAEVLGQGLRRAYGEPERQPMPERLAALVRRLEEAEREATHASRR